MDQCLFFSIVEELGEMSRAHLAKHGRKQSNLAAQKIKHLPNYNLFCYTIRMARFEQVTTHLKSIIINNFFGGIAWAFGATIGFSIIVFVFSLIFKNLNLIPFVGEFISEIVAEVIKNLQNNPQLIK